MLNEGEIRVGDNLNPGPLYDKLTEIINATAMTADEAMALLAQMGFDAKVKETDQVRTTKGEYLEPATYTTDSMETSAGT